MKLYVLRHGDALINNSDDAMRSLSRLGVEQAARVGLTLKTFGIRIDTIFSSPLLRAKQTAEIILREYSSSEFIITEYLVSSADPRQILEQTNSSVKTSILLVGHEPQLSNLISLLIGGSKQTKLAMTKCGLAFVETVLPVKYGNGILRWLISPEEMKYIC